MIENILEVKNLTIKYETRRTIVHAVNDINLVVQKGKTLGLVGETGAGKTTTALGIMQLIPEPPGKIIEGQIYFKGQNLLTMTRAQMRKIRGSNISMIFQDPMTALNPIIPIGDQIAEVIKLHKKSSAAEAMRKAQDMLEMVGISKDRYGEYPHQFSGGMKQRVVIAIALVCSPDLLIADEPTTALDVTIQAQVIEMMNNLKTTLNTSMLLITHDLGVVAEVCDHVAIMYAGEILEFGTVDDIFYHAVHPYTLGLFGSMPSMNEDQDRLQPVAGLMPDPSDIPEGCSFAPRCPKCRGDCEKSKVSSTVLSATHEARCLLLDRSRGGEV
jgi:peptide/nickel transport system ATP-binding protein